MALRISPSRRGLSNPVARSAITPAAAAPTRLHALTSLRFFAAATIVAGHIQGCFGIPLKALDPFNSSQAVSFFFVLSGFILAWVYPSLDRSGAKAFLLARFARLWPVHLAASILVLLLLEPNQRHLNDSTRWWMTLANLSLTQAWIPYKACAYRYNVVSWSISTEAFFYLCFPLLIHRWRQTWWLKLALGAALTAGMIALCNAVPIPDGPGPLENGVSAHALIYNHPVTRIFEFVLGMTMVLPVRALHARRQLGTATATAVEIVTVGCALALMYYSARISMAVRAAFPSVGDPGILWMFPSGLCAPLFAALIGVMALNQGLLSRGLSRPALVLLGEISFSIYLLHHVIVLYYLGHRQAVSWIPDPFHLPLYVCIVLTASYLMWRYVEMPCRRIIRNFAV